MKKIIEIVAIFIVLVVFAYVVAGCDEDIVEAKELVHEQEVEIIAQGFGEVEFVNAWGWGRMAKQNQCPHCGKWSFTRFCSNCGKERGNLPFVGVYCPKCNPKANYASLTGDIDKICTDCGGKKTWKYVYEDWQEEPVEQELVYIDMDIPGIESISVEIIAEPNEPEFEIVSFEILSISERLNQAIPTWPDYIELKKDLVIHRPGKTKNEFIVSYFHKGTHIYFRDDDD